MPFIGKQPTAGFASIVKDDLTADGSTTAFTLSKNVASANDIAVFVGNVRQEPTDAYTVSGTTLTMSAAPASAINFYVLHIAGTVESSVVPADGTITNAKIVGMASSKLTGALPAISGASLTDVATLDSNDQLSLVTHPVAQTIRHLGTSDANRSFVQTEVMSGTINTTSTTLLTLTPNSTSNAWYRNIIEVSASGHHNGVGNGARYGRAFIFDCNNSTLSTQSLYNGTDSGSGTNLSLTMSASGGSFVLASSISSNTFHGVFEIKFHIAQGQGGGAPTSWTITRGSI